MTQPSPAIFCTICNSDLAGSKRIKDKRGRYFCHPCYQQAINRQKTKAAASAAPNAAGETHIDYDLVPPGDETPVVASSPAKPTSNDDDYDLAPPAVTPKKAPAKVATVKKPASAPDQDSPAAAVPPAGAQVILPKFCPNCEAVMLPGRKICVKCNRDVTKMDKLLAMRAASDEPSKEEVVGQWAGRIMRIVFAVIVVAVVAFVLYGIYLQVMPQDIWDAYPKTREAAAREFLECIHKGTPKSYDRAFRLISFREVADAGSELPRYKSAFANMHNDFASKYGSDWIKNIKLENVGHNKLYNDDEVDFKLTLGKDTYTIATQVQIDATSAAANMIKPTRIRPVFDEDGKLHFGILDVAEYKVRETRRMFEMVGPPAPDPFDLPNRPGDGL